MTEQLRPENAPDPNHPFLLAARYNDAETEEINLPEWGERHKVDIEVAMYTAEQRALTALLRLRGQKPNPTGERVELSGEERAIHQMLTGVYFDGIMLGWRARELSE